MKRKLVYALGLGLPLLLAGCGGGSGSDTTTASTLGTTGVSTGTITGFGSVHVNGRRFNTDDSEVFRGDDRLNRVEDLKVGMVVTVEGDLSNAVATRVRFDEDIKGPLDGAVPNRNSPFSVMGQTVTPDGGSLYDNNINFPIAAGTVLEISGHRQADDSILLSFAERKDPDNINRYKVIGTVRNLNAAAQTFEIDELVVDYAGADVNDLPGGIPEAGQIVEVQDATLGYVPGSLRLAATKVEPRDRLAGRRVQDAEVEIESLVQRVNSASQFVISGITVNTGPSTRFLFGTADNIVVDARLEVEGLIDQSGQLQARKVKFEDNDARIQAQVDAGGVALANRTLTLLGIPVSVPANIRKMEDKRSGGSRGNGSLSLANIQDGDYLEIRGFIGANGAFIATELAREDLRSRIELRGPADVDPVARTVTVLGVTARTDARTEFESQGEDNRVGAARFFDDASRIPRDLRIIKVRWEGTDTSAPAKSVEIED
jgi:hypothetical protein